MRLLLSFLLTAGFLAAQPPAKDVWRVSVAALTVANVLDTQSSWGKRELNPVLANSNGRFGRESALLKLGLQGGFLGVEYLITRRHNANSKMYRALSVINFGAAAAIGSVAAHNYTIAPGR
jgi:hypothetical protein